MKYSVEKLEGSRVKFNIEIDGEEWEQGIAAAYQKCKGKYSIQGFRKGHVPRKFLEAAYGKNLFYEDAFDIILPKYYQEVLEREPDIAPVGRPDPDLADLTDDGVKFTITVTVSPEVTLGQYTGLTVEVDKVEIGDAEVDAEVALARDRASRVIEAGEDYEAKSGDIATIYFSGSVDGVKFEGGTADNYDLELGSNTFIPGFEDQLIGIKKNETRDVNVSFPDEYGAKELAGKAAVFEVICRKVSYKEMPELNDEFAKDVSEFDTLEEYKADIRSKLTEELTKRSEQTRENKLIERIVDAVTVEIPEEMTENQIEDMLNEFSYRLSYQGLKMDDYLKYSGMTEEQLKAGYREPAVKAVKSRLVLEAIIKKEGIEPASEEIEAKIAEYAKSSGKTVEEYRKKVSGREFEYIANQVLSDKLMAFLKANNTFAEV